MARRVDTGADLLALMQRLDAWEGSLNLEMHGALEPGDETFVRMNFDGTFTGWSIYSKQTGSIVVDVQKDTDANFPPVSADSIAGSTKPTITIGVKNSTATLTGWTTSFAEGDVIRVVIDSVSVIEDVYLSLRYTRSV